MARQPPSWTASIVSFTVMVLAVCLALNVAAELLREALPVLVPVGLVTAAVLIGWRWWSHRHEGW